MTASPSDNEREAMIEARKAVVAVLLSPEYPVDVRAAQIVMALHDRGFRLQGPVTVTEDMVDRANRAWQNADTPSSEEAMRAALEAVLSTTEEIPL